MLRVRFVQELAMYYVRLLVDVASGSVHVAGIKLKLVVFGSARVPVRSSALGESVCFQRGNAAVQGAMTMRDSCVARRSCSLESEQGGRRTTSLLRRPEATSVHRPAPSNFLRWPAKARL